ncbi:hypothetical protein IGI37_002071 [Enterococcus sp. AZ194]|uniref:hypothetical protein n=1 Tax=Enterococcus sp. AZ194 TaxID=2774629 RepID=UPI003F293CC9
MDLNQFRDVDLVIDKANDSFIQRQFVSQGDYKGRTLTVQITNNGVIGEVPGLTLNLRWQNQASGLTDLSALTLIDRANSIYRIEYPQHMMTPGTVVASIQILQNGRSTFTKQFELTVQKLMGEAVGIVGKAEFSALVQALAENNQFKSDVENVQMEKVDKNGVGQVKMSNLAQEIKDAITGGSVAIVGEDAITDINVVNNSLPPSKLSDSVDYLTVAEIVDGKYMQSVTDDGDIIFTETAFYWLAKLDLKQLGYLLITKSNLQHGLSLVLTDSQNKSLAYWSHSFDGGLFNYAWIQDYGDYYQINVDLLNQTYPNVKKIYVEFRIEDQETAFIRGIKSEDLTMHEWGAGQSFDKLRNVPNRIADIYDLKNESTSKITYNNSIPRFNSSTGMPEFVSASNRSVFEFELTKRGLIRFPIYSLPDQQFILVADSEGKVIKNYDSTYARGENIVSWLLKTEEYFEITIDDLSTMYPSAEKIYLVVWNKSVDGFYIGAYDAFSVEEVFPAITLSAAQQGAAELITLSEYPIVEGKTGYVYLDNINLNGNYYTDNDLYVAQTDHNDVIAGGYPIQMGDKDILVPVIRKKQNEVLESIKIVCKSVRLDAGSGQTKKAQLIGESTTEAQAYRTAVAERFSTDVMSIEMGGTRGSGNTKHEGRSGWTTEHFMSSESYNGATNSFYNPSTKKFDYSYYLAKFNIDIPDIVLLNFGINDANQGISPEQTINNLYTIMGQIRVKNPNVKFGIGLTSNLCRIENVAYRTESRRNNILKTVKALITEFDNRKSEGIYLNPMYLNIDPIWDMRFEEQPLSIYQTRTELYCTDGTHPADSTGYQKTADTTYFTIKSMFA